MSKEIVPAASLGFRAPKKKWLSLLLACLVCLASAVRAETSPQDVQEAHTLAVDGQREFNLGNYETALDLLQRSYKKNPLLPVLYNVAQCQRLLGHLEQARRVYKAFLAAAPDSPAAVFAKEKIAELDLALKAQTNAEHAAPQTLARTDKSPAPEESEPAPASQANDSKAAPPTVLVVSAPPAALPGGSGKQPAPGNATWGWWVAGGVAATAAIVVVVVLTSSSSKSVNEPAGTFSAR
jgi:hypothetical protein